MSPPKAAYGRMGRPPLTSREQILLAARQIIERDGSEKLTFRRLASEIGVGTATLYRHVRDREDLLVQLLNEHLDQTLRPELPTDPQERIVAATIAIHDSLAARPWAADILTVDGFLGRLGASALAVVETIVAGAIDCGCTREQAVDIFRSVWYYTVGEILVRTRSSQQQTHTSEPTHNTPFSSNFDPSRFPSLASIGDRWPELSSQDIYALKLRGIVDGLLRQAVSETD